MSVNLVEAQQFVTDGLVAFYTLDKADIKAGVVKNESGNGNDAKIMGTNSPLIATAKIGQSLQLDGKKVYVEIPFGEMEQASVECWALRTSFDGDILG